MATHAANPDLACARRILTDYQAPDAAQADVQARILAFIDEHPADAHLRSCLTGHLTGSVMLMDHARERVLLTLHRKLGRWLQLGGHCDGDANLVHVALREAEEESGIDGIEIDTVLLDLDIHTIPEHKSVPQHLHLDVRYVAYAPQAAVEVISEESIELGWFTLDELEALDGVDEAMLRAARVLRTR